jgi:hypothetical protein
LNLLKISARNPNLDAPTEDSLTTSTTTVIGPQLLFETDRQRPVLQVLLDVQPSDPALYPIPSSPSPTEMPSLEDASDASDVIDPSVLSDVFQDSRPSQPTDEPAASPDRMPRCQSLPSPPLSCACFPQRAACFDIGTSVPTSPVPSETNTVEALSLSSYPPAPQFEISSVIEAGVTPRPQSPTRDTLPGEVSDTRQQEPPFMTDGRGRVVWSRSGVKGGNLPPAN